jgi:hypothetical protein
MKGDGQAPMVRFQVDFRGEAAARTAKRLDVLPPFVPLSNFDRVTPPPRTCLAARLYAGCIPLSGRVAIPSSRPYTSSMLPRAGGVKDARPCAPGGGLSLMPPRPGSMLVCGGALGNRRNPLWIQMSRKKRALNSQAATQSATREVSSTRYSTTKTGPSTTAASSNGTRSERTYNHALRLGWGNQTEPASQSA